jgi:hypothetical protein
MEIWYSTKLPSQETHLGERIAFELDTMKSAAPLAKQYRAILHKAQNKDDIEGAVEPH